MSEPSNVTRQTPPRVTLKRASRLAAALILAAMVAPALGQPIQQIRGVDSRVDYAELTEIGPWDDRNYQLTRDDLELLAPNEVELKAQIPAFFRVELRQGIPEMDRTGPAQYPRSALQIFRLKYGGYLVDGKIYTEVEHRDGRYVVPTKGGIPEEEFFDKFLSGEVRITSPNGAAESAIKVSPTDTDRVVAGSNGPGTGQKMFYSTDGGESWNSSAALPGGGTCCDPTVDWSSDGSLAYTATLGNCGGSGCQIWFYRSSNGGQTWSDLPGATPRRTLSTGNGNDKEYLHVDKYAGSPHQDNLYVTWHSNNVMQVARSTNSGESWSAQSFSSDPRGIGSDITTDKNGHVYYFWPAFDSRQILLRKSTDGGTSYAPVSVVAATEGSFAFPVPSMETREVFIYVSADTDVSNGPYGGSIYAAWTDSTSATGSTPANNHARIRVATSRNGGSSWTVTTPHETADANSVDRWHQWLAVGPDGKVHVIFYDTRNGSRSTVDLYYAFSDDGAQTWSAPSRVTAQQSPNIGDSFEFGDYNGLDIVMSDLIAIYTDNRNEGGGGGDSVDVYAAGIPLGGGGGGGGGGGCGALAEDFEGGAGGWTTTGLWHLVTGSSCASPGYSSPTRAMYYGQDASCDYDTGGATAGNLVSPQISATTGSSLSFDYFRQVESEPSGAYDRTEVAVSAVGSSTWTTVWSKDSTDASKNAWTSSGAISLAAWAGQTVQLRFRFDSEDDVANGFTGWLIDDVEVTGDASCEAAVEVGQVSITHQWTTVALQGSFTDPIVVAKPASWNGSDPGVIRLRNVTPAGFQIRFHEWDYLNQTHVAETVSYVVAERGHQQLPGGGEIEAGTLDTANTRPQAFVPVSFASSFQSPPLVFSVVGTANGGDAVATRQRSVSANGFEVVMQEQQSKSGHLTETLHWIAWTPGSGSVGSTPFQAGTRSNVTHAFATVTFPSAFAATPCVIADLQSFNGSDPASLRYRSLTAGGVEVQVDEEQSADTETSHIGEVVGYLALDCD